MKYDVLLKKEAAKYLSSLDKPTKSRILLALDGLSKIPPQGDIAIMQGMEGFFRLRVGSYRVIFTINEVEKAVCIQTIGPRGDVYKK
jgi:mRNA interferase RelE/StbE